jgi:hypothetical protein
MTPLDTMARALTLSQSGADCFDALDEAMQESLRENVRAVLAALREPSEEMLKVGAFHMAFDCWRNDVDEDPQWPHPDELDESDWHSWRRTATAGFQAMLKAALAE